MRTDVTPAKVTADLALMTGPHTIRGSHALPGRLGTRLALLFVAGAVVGLLGLPSTFSRGGPRPKGSPPVSSPAEDAYARLPMSFVPNRGQMPEGIGYGARGIG